ncbi:MAG: hypothetical protein JSR59_26805 [Proteobacteria bacterium]|nr:hypothetical protein [Pseudomonadota bacterium]
MKHLLGKRLDSLFATRTLSGHQLRGAAAFGLLAMAVGLQHAHGALSLEVGLLALVLLRGCPMCWLIGLIETVRQRRHGGVE